MHRAHPALVRTVHLLAAASLSVCCASAIACTSSPPRAPAPPEAADPDARAAIAAVLAAQRDAWNRGDLRGYMDGYERSDALVFTSGAKVTRGWQATLDKYLAKYDDDTSGLGKLAFELLDVRVIEDRAAIVLGRWRLTDTPNAGSGVFSVVLARTADGWRIIHDHTSADP